MTYLLTLEFTKMRYLSALLLTLLTAGTIYSQKPTGYELDFNLAEIPNSPAFILMGNSPSEIESPESVSDLVFSIQNASESFTQIPQNYFIGFNPYWAFNNSYVDFDDYSKGNDTNIKNNILQSLNLSIGISDSFQGQNFQRRMGFGASFSLIRGDIDSEIQTKYFNKLSDYNRVADSLQRAAEGKDPLYLEIQTKINATASKISKLLENGGDENNPEIAGLKSQLESLNKELSARQKQLSEEIENEYVDKTMKELSEVVFKRTGFFLNLAGGTARDLTDSTSKIFRSGFWVNTGIQETNYNINFLGRFLSHNNVMFLNDMNVLDTGNFTTVDVGLKVDFNLKKKANLSAEFIYRSIPNTQIESTFKSVINFRYALSKDVALNFSYGKDFDPFLTGKNQYISMVNLVAGIGNSRKLNFDSN